MRIENALSQTLCRHGADMQDFHGRLLPRCFSNPKSEWRAMNERCAVFAAGFRSMVAVSGEDRATFLQGMLSNDLCSLTPGRGRRAAHLTRTGKVVADVRVYMYEGQFLLDVFAARREALCASLRRHVVADDVELDVPAELQPVIGLEGPDSGAVLGRIFEPDSLPAEDLGLASASFAGAPLLVINASETRGTGALLCASAATGAALFDAFCKAGATPAGMEALNIRRVEAGIPWYGADITEDTLLMETGLDDAVSFDKGCYLGQEVVERIAARGQVKRKLTRLLLDGTAVPAPGTVVTQDDGTNARITSAVYSPALGRPVALAYVGARVEQNDV